MFISLKNGHCQLVSQHHSSTSVSTQLVSHFETQKATTLIYLCGMLMPCRLTADLLDAFGKALKVVDSDY